MTAVSFGREIAEPPSDGLSNSTMTINGISQLFATLWRHIAGSANKVRAAGGSRLLMRGGIGTQLVLVLIELSKAKIGSSWSLRSYFSCLSIQALEIGFNGR